MLRTQIIFTCVRKEKKLGQTNYPTKCRQAMVPVCRRTMLPNPSTPPKITAYKACDWLNTDNNYCLYSDY